MQPMVPINNGGVGPATQAAQASGKPSTLGMKPDNLIVDRLVGVCALVPVRKISKLGPLFKPCVYLYYKVDGDGKIERLRRECPSPECGAGIFMAAMHNRQYCGKCHLTYVFDESK
ncbi:hypothetical protein GB937_005920 [Aspergillus fischeri]|nr:hypothetical protein GB937_005920 [Aspergillus fischeri]